MSGAALVAAAATFDLLCSGSGVWRHYEQTQPLSTSFRLLIDLDQRRWCRDECKETRPIVRVSETELVLEENQSFGRWAISLTVNRESGRFDELSVVEPSGGRSSGGTCKAAPFSGFPARKF